MRLAAHGISARFGDKLVLSDVSIVAEPGRVLALVGPNGAGKSTLLAALSGDVPHSDGSITLDERPLNDWTPQEMAQRRAVLLQHNDVAFSFSAREVVLMGRAPWTSREEAARDTHLVTEAMIITDVTHLAERSYRSLSGGEKARVSLARVLAQNTPTVLLDEPTAALDLRHQEDVMLTTRRLAAEGRAVVVVLHDLSLAAAYADDVAVLCDGRLTAHGSPADVLTPQLIEDVYGTTVHRLTSPEGHPILVPVRGHELHTATRAATQEK